MFEPHSAYVAAIDKDGNVLSGEHLVDPSFKSIIIVEFNHNRDLYRAIYHDELDVWEFPEWVGQHGSDSYHHERFRLHDNWYAVYPGQYLYEACNETVARFKDQIYHRYSIERFHKIKSKIDRLSLTDPRCGATRMY